MDKITLTSEQVSAVNMVKNSQVSILTGAAGTGKTTVIEEVIAWGKSERMTIACAAPSGKAAKRMTEATGFPARTIHSLLAATMDGNGVFHFSYGIGNHIDCDLIILDEVSMVSNSLMASFMRAIALDTTLLFVGDPNQLPSIQSGAILRDLLSSKVVPHVELKEVHRARGNIVMACNKIKDGIFYDEPTLLDVATGENVRHIECDSMEQIHSTIVQLVAHRMPCHLMDPIWDVQVISPVNKKTILSCRDLNSSLQGKLNPAPDFKPPKGCIFRPGDKVINTKNKTVDDGYIVNGSMGTVRSIISEKKQMLVDFQDPEIQVRLPLGQKSNDLLLAYCITCHRYQGSQAPVVIVPIHSAFGFFTNRAWLYTALSRGQHMVITVGQFAAIKKSIRTKAVFERNTRLSEKLTELYYEEI